MVWGVFDSNSFGDFFPGGQFVGWDEELEKYFREEMDQESREHFARPGFYGILGEYSSFVRAKFRKPVGSKTVVDLPSITPIEPHEPPKRFETREVHEKLGSMIELNDRIFAVEETLKNIIEKLEPGVHGFFPIQITMPKNVVYPKQYYTIVVDHYFDSFTPDRSAVGSWAVNQHVKGRIRLNSSDKENVRGLAFSRSVFGKAHLWRELLLSGLEFFVSDELHNEVARASLRLPKHLQMTEVP